MRRFEPDYNNIVKAARNIETKRLLLYEHLICTEIMETVFGKEFMHLAAGDDTDLREYFRNYCEFFKTMG